MAKSCCVDHHSKRRALSGKWSEPRRASGVSCTTPSCKRAARRTLGLASARPRSSIGEISAVPFGTGVTGMLQVMLELQIAETDHLRGLLCTLQLPILHLSPDLRLDHFSQAAALLFGFGAADLGRWLDFRWPTAPRRAMAEACRTGKPFARLAEGPDGKDWQCHIVPHAPHNGALASVMVVLLAQPESDMVDQDCAQCGADLTPRQRQVMELVLAGHASKNIAADLNISQRTVENHRAAIMKRTGATSWPALARIAVGAAGDADHRPHNSQRALPHLRA